MGNLAKTARAFCAAAAIIGVAGQAAAAPVTFTLINTGGAEVGTDAYYGFTAAANFWSSVLSAKQATNVVIDIGFDHLGADILGSTDSNFVATTTQNVEARIAASSSGSAFDAAAVAGLPTLSPGALGVGALNVWTPGYTDPVAKTGIDNQTKDFDTDGGYNNSVLGLTSANAKALGFNVAPGTVDASITFSSDFAFDFDPTNGITAGTSDFLGVAIHEMGHALGFVSGVDDYDVLGTGGPYADSSICGVTGGCKNYDANDDWMGETLDLYRYSADGALDWTTGTESYFSVDKGVTQVFGDSDFSTGSYNGDGWQASHWKAPINSNGNFTCSPFEGVMNPYLCDGANAIVTGLDLAALDAIGWNLADNVGGSGWSVSTRMLSVPVPEATTWAMMIVGVGFLGLALRRNRRSVFA